MVAIFLIPAAGFYYNKHSCSKSGEVRFVIDDDYTCCATDSKLSSFAADVQSNCDAEPAEESTCCTEKTEMTLIIEEPAEDCCSNEGRYLKTDDDYTSPLQIELPHIDINFTIAYHSVNFFGDPGFIVEEKAHSPPFIIPSKNILLQNSVLLI